MSEFWQNLDQGCSCCRDKTVGLAPALWIRSQMLVRRLRERDGKHAPSPSAWVGTPNDEGLPENSPHDCRAA
jgi:hypothetical protein